MGYSTDGDFFARSRDKYSKPYRTDIINSFNFVKIIFP